MIPILYDSSETAFISNGLGRLRDIKSAKVVEERNGIYECDFEYPVDGAHFDQIQCGCVIATTHDDSGNVDLFDIVSHSKPINGIVTFHAVHVSYRLGGVVCRAQNINSLDAALQAMVETAVPSDTMGRFTLGADFQSNGYMAAFDYIPRSARQLMGGIEGSILDTYGGEWEFSGFNVTLKRARGSLRDFTIRYGLNLLDYKDDTDYSGTFVSCVPFWVGVDGTGGETVVSGNKVDSGASSYTGRDICVPLDLTEKFQDAPTTAQLESMAATYMTANQTNMPAQNIAVDFVRLQDMGEFEEFENLLQCNLCDSIKVVFPLYNMSGTFKIVKTTYDVLKERYESMELGALSTTLAEALGISESAKSINTIEDFAVSGDLSVGGDAAIVGDINIGGGIETGGAITINNGNTNGIDVIDNTSTLRHLMYVVTSTNNVVIGYPWYSGAANGDLYIGGNTLRLMSANPIVINNQIDSFYKITTVAVSVGAISAGSYESGADHTMTAQSGYHAVAIAGWTTSNFRIRPTTHRVDSDTVLFSGFANTSTSNVSAGTTVTFRVLWLKATSA